MWLLLVPYCSVLVVEFRTIFLIIDAQLCLTFFLPIAFNHFYCTYVVIHIGE
jgi:hypothetical protein